MWTWLVLIREIVLLSLSPQVLGIPIENIRYPSQTNGTIGEHLEKVVNMRDQLDDRYLLYKQELNYIVNNYEKNMVNLQKLYKNPLKSDTFETELILHRLQENSPKYTSKCAAEKARKFDELFVEGNEMYESCVDRASSEQLNAEIAMIVHEKIEFDNFVTKNLETCKVDFQYYNCYGDLEHLVLAETRRISQYMADTLRLSQLICHTKPKEFGLCIGEVVANLLREKHGIMEDYKSCADGTMRLYYVLKEA